jgi:hypothetical protein
MFRSALTAIVAVILLNLLAIFALAGWLYQSDRLDSDRLARVVDMFTPTLAEEARLIEEAAAREVETQAMQTQLARLEAVAEGPMTTDDRLARQQERDELAEARVLRLQRDIADLQRQLELAQAQITKDRTRLQQDRAAFEQARQREVQMQKDANFQQAVRTFEQLRPRQVKQMFQTLMDEGKSEQVVDYLAAMQLRKAAAVLKEFRDDQEIAQATSLIQELRKRGVDVMGGVSASAAGDQRT